MAVPKRKPSKSRRAHAQSRLGRQDPPCDDPGMSGVRRPPPAPSRVSFVRQVQRPPGRDPGNARNKFGLHPAPTGSHWHRSCELQLTPWGAISPPKPSSKARCSPSRECADIACLFLVGDEQAIQAEIARCGGNPGRVEIRHASEVVGMGESPVHRRPPQEGFLHQPRDGPGQERRGRRRVRRRQHRRGRGRGHAEAAHPGRHPPPRHRRGHAHARRQARRADRRRGHHRLHARKS